MSGVLAALVALLTVPGAVLGPGQRKPRHRAHRFDHRTGDRTVRGRHLAVAGAHRAAVAS